MNRDELSELARVIRELADIEEIRRLKSLYFEYVDTQQWERWGDEVLAEDVSLQTDGGLHEGRDHIVAFMSNRMAGAVTVHHGHMPNIRITGPDSATGTWAMQDYVRLPTADGSTYMLRGNGHYHDHYVRTDRGWRIQRSSLSRLHVDVEILAPDPGQPGAERQR